jgi:predicted SAM-dependent methyltransferase
VIDRIRTVLKILKLEDLAITLLPVIRRLVWVARKIAGIDQRIRKRYFKSKDVRMLQIGCGNRILDGWLNADLFPLRMRVMHLNAIRRFPFGNETFDYIFSEHMIEHVSYPQGVMMLSECCRILKKGGKIRISTPDLTFLSDLHREKKSQLQESYVKWVTERIIRSAPSCHSAFVINNFVRAWGHQFIYDEKVLSESLKRAGFSGVVRCALSESSEAVFRNLENEQRMPEGFLRLETMTLEGTKV